MRTHVTLRASISPVLLGLNEARHVLQTMYFACSLFLGGGGNHETPTINTPAWQIPNVASIPRQREREHVCETVELCNNRRRISTRVPDKPYLVVTPWQSAYARNLMSSFRFLPCFFGWNEAWTCVYIPCRTTWYTAHRTQ
jgi:hypothetical protein